MSNEPCDPARLLPHIERDQPTTPFDVATLRRLRGSLPPGWTAMAATSSNREQQLLAARPTSEGWEQLTLEKDARELIEEDCPCDPPRSS